MTQGREFHEDQYLSKWEVATKLVKSCPQRTWKKFREDGKRNSELFLYLAIPRC